MKRLFYLVALAVVLLAVGGGRGGPSGKFVEDKKALPPFATRFYTLEFKGGQRSVVFATGKGESRLGLYVYDTHGNCIAWDDEGNLATPDDCVVEWTPAKDGFYTVEIRNGGPATNKMRVAMR
jgi:hypothetical protein